jgi:hypothetical protein
MKELPPKRPLSPWLLIPVLAFFGMGFGFRHATALAVQAGNSSPNASLGPMVALVVGVGASAWFGSIGALLGALLGTLGAWLITRSRKRHGAASSNP